MMIRKCLRIISLSLHGTYAIICFTLLIVFATPLSNYVDGHFILDLWYIAVMTLGALLLIGLILNIFAMPRKRLGETGGVIWLVWTLLAPFFMCILCFVPTYILLSSGE